MAGILFEDIFDVKDIDPDGKKFERGNGQPMGLAFSRDANTNTSLVLFFLFLTPFLPPLKSHACSVKVRVSRWILY